MLSRNTQEIERIIKIAGADGKIKTHAAAKAILFDSQLTKDSKDIVAAAKKLTLAVHPDKNSDNIDRATQATKLVNEARDLCLLAEESPQTENNSLFNDLFGEESSFMKGPLIAQLRSLIANIAGVNMAQFDYPSKIEAAVSQIEHFYGDSSLIPDSEDQDRILSLIKLLFPKKYIPSSQISMQKTASEWQNDLLFMKAFILRYEQINNRYLEVYNQASSKFLTTALSAISSSLEKITASLPAIKNEPFQGDFLDFYAAALRIDKKNLDLKPDSKVLGFLNIFMQANRETFNKVLESCNKLYQAPPSSSLSAGIKNLQDLMKLFFDQNTQNKGNFFYYFQKRLDTSIREFTEQLFGDFDIDYEKKGLEQHINDKLHAMEAFLLEEKTGLNLSKAQAEMILKQAFSAQNPEVMEQPTFITLQEALNLIVSQDASLFDKSYGVGSRFSGTTYLDAQGYIKYFFEKSSQMEEKNSNERESMIPAHQRAAVLFASWAKNAFINAVNTALSESIQTQSLHETVPNFTSTVVSLPQVALKGPIQALNTPTAVSISIRDPLIESVYKKLVKLTDHYLEKKDLDPHKKSRFEELQAALKSPAHVSTVEKIKNYNGVLEKIENAEKHKPLMNQHRTNIWTRYLYNALSILTLLPMVIRASLSQYHYGSLVFWKPESKKAIESARETLDQIAPSLK